MNNTFEKLADELIKYLNDHHNPHTTIIITPTGAEIVEGVKRHHTEKFIRD